MSFLYDKAEKYIQDIFWTETHDKDNKLNIEQAVHNKLIKDNVEKDPEYYGHREGVLHVSSASKCLRGVVLSMLGAKRDTEIDPQKLGVFKAGNFFEDYIVEALSDKVLDRQTEYIFKYKGIIVTGRDDGTIENEGMQMVLENKSVHSDSFWHRQKEGTLVAAHNQMQIQTYLWLRRKCLGAYLIDRKELIYTNLTLGELINFKGKGREYMLLEKPDNSNLNGIFCYISKDDCTIVSAPVKFNQNIIDNVVLPAWDIIIDAYEKKDARVAPLPPAILFSESRNQWQKNWMCTYCDYHEQCAGKGWVLEASNLVTQRNKEMKEGIKNPFEIKKSKPNIQVEE